jgi:hypothetical protein
MKITSSEKLEIIGNLLEMDLLLVLNKLNKVHIVYLDGSLH